MSNFSKRITYPKTIRVGRKKPRMYGFSTYGFIMAVSEHRRAPLLPVKKPYLLRSAYSVVVLVNITQKKRTFRREKAVCLENRR